MSADIRPLREVVKEHIILALRVSHWRPSIAAKLLGITQRHVYNKVHEYELDLYEIRRQQNLQFGRHGRPRNK